MRHSATQHSSTQQLRDAVGGHTHLRSESIARVSAESFERAADADGGDDVPPAIEHGGAHRRNARLALFDALRDHRCAGTGEHLSRRPDCERKEYTDRHDPLQRMARLHRHHTAPGIVLAHVQLHTLTRVVAQLGEHRGRELGQGKRLGRTPPEPDELETEAEAALHITPYQLMPLERDGESVGRGPGRPVAACSAARSSGPAASACRMATPLSMTATFDTLSIFGNAISHSEIAQ